MRSWKAINKGFNKLAYERKQWAEKKAGTPSCSSPTDVNRVSGRKATLCKGAKKSCLVWSKYP